MSQAPVMIPPGVSRAASQARSHDASSVQGTDAFMQAHRKLSSDDVLWAQQKGLLCRSCSGYGSCGSRTYMMRCEGSPVVLCGQRMLEYEQETGQIPFNDSFPAAAATHAAATYAAVAHAAVATHAAAATHEDYASCEAVSAAHVNAELP